MSQLNKLRPTVRLTIGNPDSSNDSAFGPGVAALCLGVRERGSLSAAAKNMGMAYSKAWRIIKEAETSLGFCLMSRCGRQGSELTEDGNKLLNAYLDMEWRLTQAAVNLYDEKV